MGGPFIWGPTGPKNLNSPSAGAVQSDASGNITAGVLPVSSGGTGTSTAFTLGSVVFAGASGVYSQNNANFFWNNTNARLGIGTNSPSATLSVYPNVNSITGIAVRGDNNNGQPIQTWSDNTGVVYASIGYAAAIEGGRGYLNLNNPTTDSSGAGIKFTTNSSANIGLFQLDGSGNMVFRNSSSGGTFFDDNNASGFIRFRVGSGFTQAMNITSAGVVSIPNLTASLPVKTDSSKNLVSGAINLASSEVTGTLPIANGGTNNGSLAVTAGGVTYTDGTKLVNTGAGASGQYLKSNGSSAPTWQSLPVVNYIANGYADNGTTGWATYADAAGTSPVDGTGGTATVTIAASATSPLVGSNSFILTKTAANLQGNGWSYDFTIDAGYKAKVLQISANYLIQSGTFVAGSGPSSPSDVTVWIYDVTNAVLIQPSSISFLSNSSTISDQFNATFQTSSNSTSYRLIFHVGSTSASAYTIQMDQVTVSPSTYVYDTPITDWQSYTPTFTGFGTATNILFYWRRVGSDIQIKGVFASGTVTAVEGRVSLPPGITSSSFTAGTGLMACGEFFLGETNTSHGGAVLIEPSVTYMTFSSAAVYGSGSTSPLSKSIAQNTVSSNQYMSLLATIQGAGLSSSVQTSDQTDTRVVAMRATTGTMTSIASGAVFPISTVSFDTHGSMNLAASGRYTIPVAGYYKITGMISFSSGVPAVSAYKNGSSIGVMFSVLNGGVASGSLTAFFNTGDIVDLRPDATTTTGVSNAFSVERISGPSAIAASESVSARYYVSAGASTTSSQPINYDTKDWDSHNAVVVGAGVWKFTAPISGVYQINNFNYFGATGGNTLLFKNGATFNTILGVSIANTTGVAGMAKIRLLAGDYIEARPNATVTPTSQGTLSGANYIEILRVGNY